MKHSGQGKIGIIGAGSIGIAFAIVFARAGRHVSLYDPDAGRRSLVIGEIAERLRELHTFDLLDEDAESILARVRVETSLEAAAADAELVEECAPERVDIKRELFAKLDAATAAATVLASASSALLASSFAGHVDGRHRCLVAHPVNPPYLIPVIELVPAPFTAGSTMDRAAAIFRDVAMRPVCLGKEIEGFVFNRLQGAVLREAYCLVSDGIATVDEIDALMIEALGMRWSVVGPFETVDLNTRGGIGAHAQKMGPAYERMAAQRGQHVPWTPELVARVEAARRAALPLDQWESRVAWRDRQLMALALYRRSRFR